MSTKSTILLTNCCHIYHDYFTLDDGCIDMDREILVVDVGYDYTCDSESSIEVEWNSDFSAMIRFMVKSCGTDELDKFCRQHWLDSNKDNKY